MIFHFFRISGFKHSPEHFIHEWALEPSGVWAEGELSPRGRPYKDSGFAIALPDADSWPEALPHLMDFIESRRDLFAALRDMNADVNLSIGVTVGSNESFAPSLDFSNQLLTEIAACDINLTITGYPTSDES
jgi:hypothetical protein